MLVINICLVVSSLVATLAAFGGDTWIKGNEPIFRRITPRGWVSLAALLFAFGLGVTKEILSYTDREEKAEELAKLEEDSVKQRTRIESQVKKIAVLQSQLDKALADATQKIGKKIDTPKVPTEKTFENGVFSITTTASERVSVLDFEIISVISADLKRPHQDYIESLLPGGIFLIGASSPGVLYQFKKENTIFSINMDDIYKLVLSTREKILKTMGSNHTLDLSHFTCVRIKYNDDHGNHFQHYLSLRIFDDTPPRAQDMHDSRFFYDDCTADYFSSTKLEFWSDNSGQNLLAQKILSNILRSN